MLSRGAAFMWRRTDCQATSCRSRGLRGGCVMHVSDQGLAIRRPFYRQSRRKEGRGREGGDKRLPETKLHEAQHRDLSLTCAPIFTR